MSPDPFDLRQLSLRHERLRRMVAALLGDVHAAEDVVQDAWVRALEVGPRDPRALPAWMGTVVRRLASNERRGGGRRRVREERAARAEGVPSSDEIAERLELEERVRAALDGLDEPHRTLLRDHYLGGLASADLARREGVSRDVVRTRLTHARAALRARLERDGLGRDVHWSVAVLPLFPAPGALTPAALPLGTWIAMKKLALLALALVAGLAAWRVLDTPPAVPTLPDVRRAAPELAGGPRADDRAPLAEETAPDAPAPAPPSRTARANAGIEDAWRVRGRASDAAGAPVAGVPLSIAIHAGTSIDGELLLAERVVTDGEGRFVLAWQDPGRTVAVDVQGEDSPDRWVLFHGPTVAPRGRGEPEPISVLVLALDATVEGHVRDEAGGAVHGARVQSWRATAESDVGGAYRLRLPARSTRWLVAAAPGLAEVERSLEGLAPGATVALDFVLPPGLVVEGVVRDAAGRPLEGARVASFGRSTQDTLTDAAGRYRLASLPRPGPSSDVTLYAMAEGRVGESHRIGAQEAEDRLELDFELALGGRVEGRVLDPDGAPVPAVEVWVGWDPSAWDRAAGLTDDEGRFALAGVRPGEAQVGTSGTSAADWAPLVRDLRVEEGLTTDVVLRLAPARRLSGTVRDAAGAPLAGVSVTVRQGRGDYVGDSARSDAEGAFSIGGLPAGPLTVEAFAQHLLRTATPVAADATQVEVVMRRAGRLSGRVVDAAAGTPLSQFTVRLTWPSDPALRPVVQGLNADWLEPGITFQAADGAWSTGRYDELEPGAWLQVEVRADGYAPLRLPPVQVASPDDDALLLHALVPPVDVELVVTEEATGAPLAGIALRAACVEVPRSGDPTWETTTDAAGTALLAGVAPGPLHVGLTLPGGLSLALGPYTVPDGGRRAVLDVRVPTSGEVRVRLLDEDGAPVVGAPVALQVRTVPHVPYGQLERSTDAAGIARFEHVPDGTWEAGTVRRDGDVVALELSRVLTLDATAAREIELRPAGRAVLQGTVTGAVPGTGTRITVDPVSGEGPRRATFVHDGAFEVRGLAPGPHAVALEFWDHEGKRFVREVREVQVGRSTRPTVLELAAPARDAGR